MAEYVPEHEWEIQQDSKQAQAAIDGLTYVREPWPFATVESKPKPKKK